VVFYYKLIAVAAGEPGAVGGDGVDLCRGLGRGREREAYQEEQSEEGLWVC